MANFTGHYAHARRREREILAQQGYDALKSILSNLPSGWADPRVLDLFMRHREGILTYLQTEDGLSRTAFFIADQLMSAVSSADDFQDPTIASNIAALFGLLLDTLVPAFPEDVRPPLAEALDASLVTIVRHQVDSFGSQVGALTEFVRRVLEFVNRINLGGSPIVLLELPIGNSLPLKLLQRFLERRGYSVATILASLSRNDSKRRGVTRAQLLEERLAAFDFSKGGLVLYIDEWESGANFYNLCPLIAKSLQDHPGTFLLPIGLLTANSAAKDRFASFREQHDGFARKLGEAGDRWRIVVPPLVLRFGRPTYFFWGEHDRSAGYRKMQFLGSFISTVKAGVDKLLSDRKLMLAVKHLSLGDIAEELERAGSSRGISSGVVKGDDEFVELFHESATEFAKLLPELEALEHNVNTGAIDDGEEAMKKVFDAVGPKINESRAKLCVHCSLRLSEMRDRVNPEDRYYYRKYAPTIVNLEGPARRYHEVLLDEIYRRVEQLIT